MEQQALDLRSYTRLLRKWWLVLVTGAVVAALAAFFVTERITPVYESSVKVQVQGGQTPGLQSASDIEASRELARNYSDLIKTRPIMEQVIKRLEIPLSSGALVNKISINSPRSLIVLKVRDADPDLAAKIANGTAQIFIDDFRGRQFQQIAQFQASLSQYGISQDPSIIAAQASALSTLSIVEEARPSGSPVNQRTRLNVLLGVMLGLLASGLVVFLFEHMDDRIKSTNELKAITGLPVVGSVIRHEIGNGRGPLSIFEETGHGPLSESYKFLHTNLEFAAVDIEQFRTLLVTSSSPEEGKTTTAANLAISMAKEGKSVLLVDADLRKPALHRIFGLPSQAGLTNVLIGDKTVEDAMASTEIEGLKVISSGPLPPDAAQVLRSRRMKEVLEDLKNRADLIIIDSPPLLSVTDPMLLTPLVDAVLLVVDAHRTSRDTLRRGVEVLAQASPQIAGTVLNKIPANGGSLYYYHHYYYNSDGNERQRNRMAKLVSKVLHRGRSGTGKGKS